MYEVKKSGARITFTNVEDFNLDHILDCGQCFRWKKESGSPGDDSSTWYGVVGDDFARVSYKMNRSKLNGSELNGSDEIYSNGADNNLENNLFRASNINSDNTCTVVIESTNTNENFWIKYFDLDRDYSTIKEQLSKNDPIMREAIESGWGIRILKQDEWETVISFIISQNSNIPRIKACIETLCREYGKEIGEYRGEKQFSFPTIDTLAGLKESDLQVCRLGYRSKYIAEAARQISRDDGAVLEVASSMGDVQVIEYLRGISGIGPKVASCIMLFSMAKLNIFPIDVWVKRVMNRLYGIGENDVNKMKEYADEHFGKFGGIAQQYLFYYIRTLADVNPELYRSLNSDSQVPEEDKPDKGNPLGKLLAKLKHEDEVVNDAEVALDEESADEDNSDEDNSSEEVSVENEVDEVLAELMKSNDSDDEVEAEESTDKVINGLGDFKI